MKNKKGFTLVELLVVIVILGIITGLSIPLIRNVSASMEKKKYKTYSDSLLNASKLYNDSYSEDLFGHNENGCAYVTYEQLVERNLLKDIEISDVSCNSSSTFVRILKIGDKYAYSPFLGCGKKKNGKANSIDTTLPIANHENVMKPEYCTGTEENNLEIVSVPVDSKAFDKKKKKAKIKITSGTGINPKIVLSYKWSTSNTNVSGDFTSVSFKVPGNQKEKLLNGEVISTQSADITTPDNSTGNYYLIIKVDQLQDLYGSKWKNKNPISGVDSKYMALGPFAIDNHKPDADFVIASTITNYNSLNTTVKITANDQEVGKNVTYCISKSNDNCNPTTKYVENKEIPLKMDGTYDGKERTVYIAVKDVAGNVTRISKKYKVAKQYVVLLDSNGSTTPGSLSTSVMNGNTQLGTIVNPRKVVTITYINNEGATVSGGDKSKEYTLNGWYTAASGGSKVASNSTAPALEANVSGYTNSNKQWIKTDDSTTLYAHWNPVTATLPTVTKTDNNCHWETDNNGTVTVASGGTWKFTSANSRTFRAKCISNKYTITYNLDGGTVSPANKTEYTASTNTFTLTNPTRTGYTFTGWSGTGLTGSANKTVTISKGSTGNRSYTAHWTINKVYIRYHMNSGTWGGSTNTHLKAIGSFIAYDNNTSTAFSVNYGAKLNLANYNNPDYINIGRKEYVVTPGKEWCTGTSGNGTCYNHSTDYTNVGTDGTTSTHFCDARTSSCTVTLYVGWIPAVASNTVSGKTTYYATLQAALNASTTGTSKLLTGTAENITISASTNKTLDLNGKTMTGNVTNNGIITVTGNGTIKGNVVNNKTYTMSNGTIKNDVASGVHMVTNNGTFTSSGGTLNVTNSNNSVAFYNNAGKTATLNNITLNSSGYVLVNEGTVNSTGSKIKTTSTNRPAVWTRKSNSGSAGMTYIYKPAYRIVTKGGAPLRTSNDGSKIYYYSFDPSNATGSNATPDNLEKIDTKGVFVIENYTWHNNYSGDSGYGYYVYVFGYAATTKVECPSWDVKNGQDDLVWHEAYRYSKYHQCSMEKKEHKNRSGDYNTHIYVTPKGGSRSMIGGFTMYWR